MKYRLLLTNLADGEQREIIVPAHLPLEDLSVKAKVEFSLPLCDHAWHRFLFRGITCVPPCHLVAEPEIRYECNLRVGRYRSSEHTPLKWAFTSLGSSIVYQQDHSTCDLRVRFTLVERIA